MELTEQLRKNRNDLIFLKSNICIPEDVSKGPNEDIVNLDDIIIPSWMRVFEIPDTPNGISNQRNEYLQLIDKSTTAIDAALGIINADEYTKFSTCALDINALNQLMDYNKSTMNLISDFCRLIPDNHNTYLTRNVAFINQIYGKCHPVIYDINEYIISYYSYMTDNLGDASEWLEMFDSAFENGIYLADYDTEITPLVQMALKMFSQWIILLSNNSTSSWGPYKNSELIKSLLEAQTSLADVMSKDFHLERSKVELKPFSKNITEIRDFIPKLPYDYVHQRYYIDENTEEETVNEITPHIYEHLTHRIGDIII